MYNACDKDTLYLLDRSSIEKRHCPQAIAQAGAKLHKANDSEAHSTIMGISGNVKALKHVNERGILQKKLHPQLRPRKKQSSDLWNLSHNPYPRYILYLWYQVTKCYL